ncbi:hypothetical protein [Salipiger mangrovisoli]|uniref:DUF4177 domain-containing protein n=1 Tax=Salipiger mangrovisoli TaxID=2865933 RepID=A0ABR9X4G7_9RHOB|nr:hypothetical protein [Salipiger mangrovisoli]MBE9638401.1 hypothetical protein [Salipiger mangrovisoli]
MKTHEYKVLPAPTKGEKAKAAKGPEGRFAVSMSRLLNEMAEQGWDYIRADTLPSEERSGLTSSTTVWRTLLVFRRPVPQAPAAAPFHHEPVAVPIAPPLTASPPEETPEPVMPTREQQADDKVG